MCTRPEIPCTKFEFGEVPRGVGRLYVTTSLVWAGFALWFILDKLAITAMERVREVATAVWHKRTSKIPKLARNRALQQTGRVTQYHRPAYVPGGSTPMKEWPVH